MDDTSRWKTAGVLGGAGVDATIDFLGKVVRATTPVSCEQEHIRMLLHHNPAIPNRNDAICGRGPSVGPVLAQMAADLERWGADFLVMPCNTAHAFVADILSAVKIPFISIIDETINFVRATYPGAARIGVLAAEGCLHARLYDRALARAGLEIVRLSPADVPECMGIIYEVKRGCRDPGVQQRAKHLADIVVAAGAQVLVAGCTEIPLVLNGNDVPVPFVDSGDVLATRTVEYAKNLRAL